MFMALQPYLASISLYLSAAAPYAALGALLLAVLGLVLLFLLRRRIGRLARGKNGSMEETIDLLAREMKEMQEFRAELEQYLKFAESRLRGSVQGVGVVRFNPFEAQGGNQSFAAAFLDERGDGAVFSTLYARERVSVYCKPIEGGSSTFDLTDEEKEAINRAKQSIAKNKKK